MFRSRPGAEARRPSGHVLDDEDLFQRVQVGADRVLVHALRLVLLHVRADRRQERLRSLQTRERAHQAPDASRIPRDAVHPRDVRFDDRLEIVDRAVQRHVAGLRDGLRPSAPADQPGDVLQGPGDALADRVCAGEEAGERHRTGGLARLPEAHGPHSQPRNPARPGVDDVLRRALAPLVAGRNGRARQDEVPPTFGVVDMVADGIPELRGHLPFVDQAGRVALEQLLDVRRGQRQIAFPRVGVRHVEGALRDPFAGRRLAAPLRPLDKDRARSGQLADEQGVRNASSVVFRCFHATILPDAMLFGQENSVI